MGLPTFSDAAETAQQAAQSVRESGRVLIPWLPDPPTCPACGSLQLASETFDPVLVAYVTSWYCEACDQHWRREPEYGESTLSGPSEGSDRIRSLFSVEKDG